MKECIISLSGEKAYFDKIIEFCQTEKIVLDIWSAFDFKINQTNADHFSVFLKCNEVQREAVENFAMIYFLDCQHVEYDTDDLIQI